MKRLIATLMIGTCVLAGVYLIGKHLFPQVLYTSTTIDIAVYVIDSHNKIRQEHNLQPLRFNQQLANAAQKHAQYMADTDRLSHYGKGLSRPSDRVSKEGYSWQGVGENIAYGQLTVEEVMRDWMNSEGHRRNILGDYQDIGVAVAANKHGQLYWCVVFGKPGQNYPRP